MWWITKEWVGRARSGAAYFTSKEILGSHPRIVLTTTQIEAVRVLPAVQEMVTMPGKRLALGVAGEWRGQRKSTKCLTINVSMPDMA